jgi:hypothetical protein
MTLKQLINQSAYGTIGYIGSENDLIKTDRYFAYNKEVINQYAHIIIATNFDNEEYINTHTLICKHHFPNCIILNSTNNRGHNFGTADLDNTLFNYCKENNIEWLCKSANDMIIHSELLDKEVNEADFYYFMSVGYGWLLEKYDLDLDKFINDDYFYPQTNFYFINVSKTDYLNDAHYINETYNYTKSLNNYNGRVWEYIENWSCEKFLKDCVERNNLKIEHLLMGSTYISLLNFIKDQKCQDPSHKNIMMENICHLHFPEQNIIYI